MNELQSQIHIRTHTQQIESITIYASSFIVKIIFREIRIRCIHWVNEHSLDDSLCAVDARNKYPRGLSNRENGMEFGN